MAQNGTWHSASPNNAQMPPIGSLGIEEFDPMEALAASEVARKQGEFQGVNPSIEPSSTFSFDDPSGMAQFHDNHAGRDKNTYLYSRGYNPTVEHLGRQLALLEGTEAACCTSSGMAAITAVFLQLVGAGDHIVASKSLYGGTWAFLKSFAPRYNIKVSFVDVNNLDEVDQAFVPDLSKLLYFEAMSNPALMVSDLQKLASIAHKHQALCVVDNTFAPLVISPARLGADVVVHSLTKFINGASDLVGGVVCGPADFIQSLNDYENGSLTVLGGVMNPQIAWQISMRIPHLGVRMKEHSARALLFAQRLERLGVKVSYPGLPSHPGHECLKRLGNLAYGFGGMLTVDAGSLEKAEALGRCAQNEAHFGIYAVSLGFHDTLMCISGNSTAHNLTEEEKVAAGVFPGLIRMSIGFTGSAEQRWQQFHQALVATGVVSKSAKWQ